MSEESFLDQMITRQDSIVRVYQNSFESVVYRYTSENDKLLDDIRSNCDTFETFCEPTLKDAYNTISDIKFESDRACSTIDIDIIEEVKSSFEHFVSDNMDFIVGVYSRVQKIIGYKKLSRLSKISW